MTNPKSYRPAPHKGAGYTGLSAIICQVAPYGLHRQGHSHFRYSRGAGVRVMAAVFPPQAGGVGRFPCIAVRPPGVGAEFIPPSCSSPQPAAKEKRQPTIGYQRPTGGRGKPRPYRGRATASQPSGISAQLEGGMYPAPTGNGQSPSIQQPRTIACGTGNRHPSGKCVPLRAERACPFPTG